MSHFPHCEVGVYGWTTLVQVIYTMVAGQLLTIVITQHLECLTTSRVHTSPHELAIRNEWYQLFESSFKTMQKRRVVSHIHAWLQSLHESLIVPGNAKHNAPTCFLTMHRPTPLKSCPVWKNLSHRHVHQVRCVV